MSALELSQRVAQLDEMIDQLDAFMDSLMVDLVIPDPDEQERDEFGDQVLVDVPGPAGARLPVSNHGLLSARETSDPVPPYIRASTSTNLGCVAAGTAIYLPKAAGLAAGVGPADGQLGRDLRV